MQAGDILWALIWFLAGLVTFQVTSLKAFLTLISVIVTVGSILALAFDPGNLSKFVARYPVDYIGGGITHLVYLVGANLIRGNQFHTRTLWERILIYAIGLLILLAILKIYGPFVPSG